MISKPPIGQPCNLCGLCCQLQVCGAGSYALGLVERYGDRAPGPCPALEQDGDGLACGVLRNPHRWLGQPQRHARTLRDAFAALIGAGVGCDEAGDEPDATARPALQRVLDEYRRRFSAAAIRRAARIIHGPRWRQSA
jgi:hypothetical protein